jgi:hypothetical protein
MQVIICPVNFANYFHPKIRRYNKDNIPCDALEKSGPAVKARSY